MGAVGLMPLVLAMSGSRSAAILHEAFETYMGWEVYHHGSSDCCTC